MSSDNDNGTKVPAQIDVPKAGDTRGSSGRWKGNGGNNSYAPTTTDKAFKNDSQDLGVMYQRYFDCSSPQDQIRFTNTQEKLSIYVGENYKPFGRQFKASMANPELFLTLEADNLTSLQWWVDASYAVHHDYRSHTGGMLSLGKGALVSTSPRQKLNTKSSTEAELVGVDDMMGKILSVQYFIAAQGYANAETVVYQDNESAILLERNGQASSSKRTRHINVRYFFITDRVKAKEVSIQYCNTKEMLADYFTKPLQGHLFYKMRSLILNMPTE